MSMDSAPVWCAEHLEPFCHRHTAPRVEMVCPVPHCDADLYLTITSCIPLYRIDPPWPGAGAATYGPEDAVSQGWEVECTDGHTVWTGVDQIRADNAAGLTDDDETGDYAPTFRPEAMPEAQS